MALADKLFRKVALEKLSSPERLDQLIRITSPRDWVILASFIFIILVAVFWGGWGSISTTVQANGILTRTGGISSIQSPGDGIILSINVNSGDIVKAGEVVARISQVDYLNKIKLKKQELQNLKLKYSQNEIISNEDIKKKLNYFDTMMSNIKLDIENITNRISWLQEQIQNKKELLRRKLITKDKYLDAENELNAANLSLMEKRNEISKILNDKFELSSQTKLNRSSSKNELEASELELEILQIDLVLSSQVISPFEGKILDTNNKEGNFVSKGQSLFTIEKRGKDISNLKAIVYIQPYEAKNVKVGMKVNINPAHVKQEEYGFMLGLVTFVGYYPATQSSMMKELENEAMINSLSSKGAPYKFEVTLIPDSRTANGYKWSTQHGYPYEIVSGTLCSAQIVVQQQKPISFVVPLFNKYILGIGNERTK